MATHPVEEETVRAFIVLAKRDRYAAMLASRKKRAAFLDVLNHCHDFDTRYATEVSSKADVSATLLAHASPSTCHVISDCRELDGREMPITEAINRATASACGTLLCCVPGRLAFYLGEAGEQRLLLQRKS